ncbi:MAG: DEAD/DEAH box helicase [Deltaproteobacteria bacterium]|nr:DEAD/DEAH box helicase [Deltaproteobacteria bacterium]
MGTDQNEELTMRLTISNHVDIDEAPESLLQKIQSTFTLKNPAYDAADKMGRWTGNLDEYLRFYSARGGTVTIPRGAMGLLLFFCKEMGIRYEIADRRRTLQEMDFTFAGILKPYQQSAVKNILSRDFGVLQAPTGSGKTIMALAIIAARKQPALIIIHSVELLNQWIERIETFLNIQRAEIGQIGDGKMQIREKITVGIVNSVYPIAPTLLRHHFGQIIVDECHRAPARTFTEAVSSFDCQFMLGLSATPFRRDGLTKLIEWHLGRKVEIKPETLTDRDIIKDVQIITRKTDFVSDRDASESYSKVLSELTEDESRNRLIVGDIVKEASNGGGVCLALSDRKDHCETIKAMLHDSGIGADVLTGEVSNGERKAIVERLSAGKVRVLIATGQLIGEGFDAKSLQTLFLVTPIKFDGRLTQYLGRVLRPAPGKDHATIYDYVDGNVGVLAASARARAKVYRQIKGT